MRITREQEEALNQLQVTRLSDCDDCLLRKISSFENTHINEKKCSLRNEASEEDAVGTVAYYLVSDAEGNIMFYFSLKCGMLYDEFIYPYLTTDKEKSFVEYAEAKGVDIEQTQLKNDLAIDGNALMTRGRHTFSAIELAHFYRNDNYDFNKWRAKNKFPQIGIVIFWRFVVPLVLKIKKQVGCQYLYLFAADDSENRKLVNYYADKLKFRSATEWGTVKPIYDFTCEFMCQEISHLETKMKKFFNEEFNVNPEEQV